MPNQVHSTPRIRNHHQIADRSRTPARTVSRRVVDGGASLVIAGPLCSPLLAGPISRPPAGGGMAGHTLVPWCRRAGTVPKTTITVDGRRVSSQIQAPTRRRRSPRSGLPQVQPQLFTLISVSDHARGGSESLRRLVSRNTCAPSIAPAKDAAASGESLHLARGGSGRLRAGRLGRAGALGRRGARAGGIGRRARCGHRVDGLGELQDLVGQTQQLLVLLLLLLDRLPLVVGHDLALLVRAVLADQHKRRQEDGLQRDDHRQQPEGIVLDSEADPGGEPEHVDVHELHRPGEPGDLVGDAVLDVLRSLLGLLEQRRIDWHGKRPNAHAVLLAILVRWWRADGLGYEPQKMASTDIAGSPGRCSARLWPAAGTEQSEHRQGYRGAVSFRPVTVRVGRGDRGWTARLAKRSRPRVRVRPLPSRSGPQRRRRRSRPGWGERSGEESGS